MARIQHAFEHAAAANRAAFVPFLTAGFPEPARFLDYAERVLPHADLLEIGLPFSDPLGDGPVIQRASEQALRNGTTTVAVLEMIENLRRSTDKPLVLMTYFNPIYCYAGGQRAFARDLKSAGADGIILPDLPPDEAGSFLTEARDADLDTVFLVGPTSTPERIETVVAACRGFVYAVSVTGVTGARDALSDDVGPLVQRARAAGGLPVAVGFGVGSRATAAAVANVADGVVVGSALVNRIAAGDSPDRLAELAADLAAGCVRGA